MNLRCILGCATLITMSCCNPAFAGRPLVVDDAEPAAPRQFKFEAGVGLVAGHSVEHFDFPFGLTYGVIPRLEAGIGFGGQVEERQEALAEDKTVTDFGDLILRAKGKVLTADRWWADHALAFTVKFPTASYDQGTGSGKTDFDLTWIVSKPICEKWAAHLNTGYTWTGDHPRDKHDDILHYGIAADYQLSEKIQFVGEIFANTPITAENETPVRINGGIRWQATDHLVLDAAVGTGIRRDPAELTATVGFARAFGFTND